ncbi:hypothetical protein RclHR1_13070004 [Rhizophagus clarus]|uniref:Uncharacterized protein n=1 Tax=Rhizophagus clarus TaxID=94130 RepID=A0A2Z6QP39_9GLOM|nr:hypothetical protein RclHR1_13070004 [Rhizophagus clarus]GES87780.1 hypothetical protein RCL_jg27025.t1 [Rhizophagus clarus]
MTRIEQHLSLLPLPNIPATIQTSDMLIDAPALSDSSVERVSSRPAVSPVQTSLNLLSPTFTPTHPARAPLHVSTDLSGISFPSSTSHVAPSST